jgi:hypothetical protein
MHNDCGVFAETAEKRTHRNAIYAYIFRLLNDNLFFRPRLGLSSRPFPSSLPIKISFAFLISPTRYMPTHLTFLHLVILIMIFGDKLIL